MLKTSERASTGFPSVCSGLMYDVVPRISPARVSAISPVSSLAETTRAAMPKSRIFSATPIPGWKRSEWACDVLPAGDPARTPR